MASCLSCVFCKKVSSEERRPWDELVCEYLSSDYYGDYAICTKLPQKKSLGSMHYVRCKYYSYGGADVIDNDYCPNPSAKRLARTHAIEAEYDCCFYPDSKRIHQPGTHWCGQWRQ